MTDLRIPEKKFRPEIEGVRAVAALLVAVYHIWLGSVSGGVDVFFIVSGYLITTTLLVRLEKTKTINYTEYILGLGKRLFPIAYTVIFVTAIAAIFILPRTTWGQTIPQVFSSLFYYQNWQLANTAVDYLADNSTASPFQHFWALSIQGQFYVTWPLIIFLTYIIATRLFKTALRKTLLGVLILIFTSSLIYSVYITEVNQPWAYFDTFARAWEFSLGGILALLLPYLKFNKVITFVIGWVGLSIICLTGILLPVSDVFPGYAALLPTFGVILVIISAENASVLGVHKLLGSKPFVYFGSISYGFYLWHWPLLVFYFAFFQTETVSVFAGMMILVVTFILSVISIKGIESPVRNLNNKLQKKKLSGALLAFMMPVILVGVSWSLYLSEIQASQDNASVEDYPGARAISESLEPAPDLIPIPDAVNAKTDFPTFYAEKDCYTERTEDGVAKCSYGETENPDYTIALVGGSHSGHWFPALEIIAQNQNIEIELYNKDACRFSKDDFDGTLTESCMDWNNEVIEPLKQDPPDLIFTTANVNRNEYVPEGYLEMWREFEGISNVFAIRDNPRMPMDPPVCVEETPGECSIPREEGLSEEAPWETTENIPSNVYFADLSEYFCTDEECPSVIGNVLIYRDNHHITATYAKTMAPALEEKIMEALSEIIQ
ncbi:acyltransferase family protein [Jeotgalibacillus aurantiacus]|uniref:acyltransferase family protein n=1 Tax=Jeotgalibacillus aurantiacus TaxID=2763266 RepID=UPI001D0B7F20|nr:acyltransferase family protein [Jeotgalibacillus aurantiacus]